MLSAGATLGPYEVVSPLGAGGMGEVYRARDSKLGRDVALKVLPAVFTADPDRLARFEREAKVLASLNHPNIGLIYGLEEADDQKALVLELVEGPTLADRIARGPIPLDEALPIARQIAEALEAAHEQGIIHRDLKPANVKVKADGTVKVLDFGLAKAFEPKADDADADASQSPTLTARASQVGVILGTAAYMAPEQARGKPVDKRADIWAFGVVLFEMLSGARAFPGEDVSQTLARVIDRDPDWALLPRGTPEGVLRLLQRCLRKDRGKRLHDVADARLEVEEAGEPSSPVPGDAARPTPARRLAPWGIAALMATLAAVVGVRSSVRPVPGPTRAHLQITLPEGLRLATETTHPTLALSPDGSRLAFVASDGRTRRLYVRDLGDRQVRAIKGTEGAGSPFFSADGQWIAFIAGARLMKVSSSSGAPTPMSIMMPVSVNRGVTWTAAGSLVVAGSPNSGLAVGSLAAENGPVTLPDGPGNAEDPLPGRMAPQPHPGMKQVTDPAAPHTWPAALPDGRSVLFTDNSGEDLEAARVARLSLTTADVTPVGVVGSNPRYSSTGHILYGRDGALYAASFGAGRQETSGAEVQLVDGVRSESNGAVHYAVGGATLAYVAGPGIVEYELVWVDRQGRTETLLESGERMFTPRLSPDASQLALTIEGANFDVWLFDLERKSLTRRLTSHPGEDFGAVWHPDGRQLALTTELDDTPENPGPGMAWMPEPGGPLESLIKSPGWGNWEFPSSWSPDGASLAFLARRTGRADIALMSVDNRGEWMPFLETTAMEAAPAFSPAGRWLAYVSDETGRDEVYVRPFPGPGERTPVSSGGGIEPVWARDGRALFFRHGDRIMECRVDGTGDRFVASAPEPVVVGVRLDDWTGFGAEIPNYDVSPDGARFIMARRKEPTPATVIDVVLNWPETLAKASETEH